MTAAVGVAVALSGTACKDKAPETGTTAPAQPSANGPVAKVNGVDVPRDVFNKQMEKVRQRFAQTKHDLPPALESRLKENIVRKLVDDELIAQKAKSEGVALTDAEVDAKLAEHKARFGSPEAFKAFLDRTGQTEEELKDELRRTELRDRLFNKLASVPDPDEKEIKEYYEKNVERYKEQESVKELQVMWKVEPTATPEEKKKVEKRAKEVAGQLRKKGADFKAVVATLKDAAPSPNGGDLGWMPRGRQVKQIEDAVFDPKVKGGDVVGPVETNFGYHIIKVEERRPGRQKPVEEVAESIKMGLKTRLRSEKTREVLNNLKKEGKVEVLEPGVNLEPRPMPVPPSGAAPVPGMPPGHGGMAPPPAAPAAPAQPQ